MRDRRIKIWSISLLFFGLTAAAGAIMFVGDTCSAAVADDAGCMYCDFAESNQQVSSLFSNGYNFSPDPVAFHSAFRITEIFRSESAFPRSVNPTFSKQLRSIPANGPPDPSAIA